MKLKPYPKYKPSGVEWLGKAPDGWNRQRLRFGVTLNPSKSETAELDRNTEVSFLPMEAIGGDGRLDLQRTRPISDVETGYTYFRDGDVTIAKITPCFENGKGARMRDLQGGIGFGTTELIVARPNEHLNGEFLHWLFVSEPFRKQGEAHMYGAGGQKRVPDDFVRNFDMAWPPLELQASIAAFLDRETAKIDTLIARQETLIELLQEKRQAVISHAVTKGLDPTAPMKPSGVEWLGDVPVHWDVVPTKRLFRLVVDPAPPNNDATLLSIYTDIGVRPRKELEERGNKASTTDGYFQVRKGDLIVNKLLAWMGAIGVSNYDGVTSPAYDILRPIGGLDPYYYDYLFRCGVCFTEFRRFSRGIMDMRLRLYFEEFGQLHMPRPPVDEMRAIVNHINAEAAKIDTLSAKAKQAIELQKEHRTALISAAVTGKIDVRGMVDKELYEEKAA